MQGNPGTPYAPILDPSDPRSLPSTLGHGAPAYAVLRPDRRGRAAGRRWIGVVARARPVWGEFCTSDRTLRRLEHLDPLGLRLAADARVHGIVTMDTPLYRFMTCAQRTRARALHLHRLHRTLDAGPRAGLAVLPLVKAVEAGDLDAELDGLASLGLAAAGVYARELRLEGDGVVLRRFVRGAHRRRLRPVLLGAFSPSALRWGPADLAAQHHYVLARRRTWLAPGGGRVPLDAARYSPRARRFVLPGDVAALCAHNFAEARARLAPAPPLPTEG